MEKKVSETKKKKKIFNLEVVIKKEWRRNVKKNKMENCNT